MAFSLGAIGSIGALAAVPFDMWSANEDRKAVRDANNANIASAREANQWSEKMSDTAYQRAMADMEKAGLNPMLAFSQGGASVPSAQTASSQAASKGGMGRAVSKGIEAATGNSFRAQEVNNSTTQTQSNVRLQAAQSNSAQSQVALNNANVKLARTNAARAEAETKATADRNLREEDRWKIDRDLKNIDREFYQKEKWSDLANTWANTASNVISPWKGMIPAPQQKQSAKKEADKWIKNERYEKGGYGSGYYDKTYNPSGELP